MKRLKCFWCEAELEQRGGGNIAIHFVCPNGCGAWWPEEDMTDESAMKLWNSEQAYKKALAKKGGGSKAGRKRKKPQKLQKNYWLPQK
jgi:hypothetical protein